MRYAIVENDLVVNVVLWDGESAYPDSDLLVICPDEVSIGWSRDASGWIAPVPVVIEAEISYDILRQEAFRSEADPIFFQSQRGEATESDWLSKIEEIRQRYPNTTQQDI